MYYNIYIYIYNTKKNLPSTLVPVIFIELLKVLATFSLLHETLHCVSQPIIGCTNLNLFWDF